MKKLAFILLGFLAGFGFAHWHYRLELYQSTLVQACDVELERLNALPPPFLPIASGEYGCRLKSQGVICNRENGEPCRVIEDVLPKCHDPAVLTCRSPDAAGGD